MTAAEKKERIEFRAFCVITVMMLAGTGLCLACLLLPYWYKADYIVGIVKVEADIGLFQDRICMPGADCENFWLSDSDYDRPDVAEMPKFKAIRGLELAGVINAFLGLFGLLSVWCNRKASHCRRVMAQAQFFGHTLIAAFLCVTGTLLLSSEASQGDIGFASILTGVGCAFLFISACLSCLICRYDAAYGTLERPISPAFRGV